MSTNRQRPSVTFIRRRRFDVAHSALHLFCLAAFACGLTFHADASRSSARGDESLVESGDSPDRPAGLSKTASALVLEMTAIGLSSGPNPIQTLQKPLKPLRRELGEDPRINYLLGISHLRHGQYKPATIQLEEYLRKSGESGPHVHQLLIWAKLVDRRYEAGLNELVEFAKSLRRPISVDRESDDLELAAEWVGEIVAALDVLISISDKSLRQRFESCEDQLRDPLNGNLEESFEIGKATTLARVQALAGRVNPRRPEQAPVKRQPVPPRKGRTANQKSSDPDKAKANNRPIEEAKPVVASSPADVDRRLVRLEQQFQSLRNRVRRQSQTTGAVGDELAITREAPLLLDFGGSRSELPSRAPFGENAASPFFDNAADRADAVAQLEYSDYISRVDYNHLVERLAQTTREGVQVSGIRAEVLDKNPRGADRATDSMSDNYVWRTRLDALPKPVALQPVTLKRKKGKSTSPSLRDVMPLDIESEKLRIHRLFRVDEADLK